jgi:hypothetical protein
MHGAPFDVRKCFAPVDHVAKHVEHARENPYPTGAWKGPPGP